MSQGCPISDPLEAHVELRHTNIQLKNSFDLELNPFERSFAPTDQRLHGQSGPQAPKAMAPADPQLANGQNGQKAKNGTKSEETPTLLASSKLDHATSAQSTATLALPGAEQADVNEALSAGSNKHNLRLLNFQSVGASENRLPGLTPPIFTPGGRRLPPIHLSPNAAMGTPETPGSSLWSSLLNATNGQGHDGQQGQNLNYNQFANMIRKLGLTPNELNLRLGFTPGIGHQSFNFGHIPGLTPGGLNNGQMTPGLQSLLGLSHQNSVDGHSNSLHMSQAPVRQQYQPQVQPAPQPQQQQQQPMQAQQSLRENRAPAHTTAPPAAEPQPTFAIPTEPPRPMPVVKQEDDSQVKEPPTKKAKTTRAKKEKKDDKKKKAASPVDEEEEKRKQFLERNRVAASKCRQRKKQLFQKMEDELAFYSTGYRELSAQVTQLREQLLTLRGVVTSLKNLPVLINAVGGYEQLQNIIGQTDYIAQAAVNSQPNFHLIPSTIPTTLNASRQLLLLLLLLPTPSQNKAAAKYAGHPGEDQPIRQRLVQSNMMNYQDPSGGQNVTVPAEAPVEEVPRHFTGEVNGMASMQPVDLTTLRNLSSTSNLQNKPMDPGYQGLRNVASMANLQH